MHSLLSAAPTETDDPQGIWVLDIQSGPTQTSWRPPVDVFETHTSVVVRVEIAGMRVEDFHLQIIGQTLRISGQRRDPDLGTAYHRLEIPFGHFQVSVALPAQIDEHQTEAEYSNGFLRIRLPKRTPRTITIRNAA